MALRIVTEPAVEPVTVAEVMQWSRIDAVNSPGDPMLQMMIAAARRIAERDTGRKFIAQTWELVLDGFNAEEIEIGILPIIGITWIKYYDANATLQTLAATAYALDRDVLPGWILPAGSDAWPETYASANAVIVRLEAGYGIAGTDVPQDIRMWISAQVAAAYDNPSGLMLGEPRKLEFLDGLLDAYRIRRVV